MKFAEIMRWAVIVVALAPFFYYLLAIYSSWRFFRQPAAPGGDFTPPVSILKPIRGLDAAAYENFASFCAQDYPELEMLFCVSEADDPAIPVIEKLAAGFPRRTIRVLVGSNRSGSNDKVAKLCRLASEARHDVLVLSDSDIRVAPDYLRTVVAPLQNSHVGAVTCLYLQTDEKTVADQLQTIGQVSDFYAGLLVARLLDGVKFALGSTIVTTRERLAEIGGFESIENRVADDLLVGRKIAEKGHRVELLPYAVRTVADYETVRGFLHKRMRWAVVMRHTRPWGHLGLLLTQGLPWSLAAIAVWPSVRIAAGYVGAYLGLRLAMTIMIGVWGLKQPSLLKKLWLIPLWDALSFLIWLASFGRNRVRWRDGEYFIREGMLVPVPSRSANN